MRESDRTVDREPRGELVTRLELDAVASRCGTDTRRAFITAPSGLAIEIEEPARHRKVEALPESDAGADFFADCARERSHRRFAEHAAHIVGMKAVTPVQVQIEERVFALDRRDREARLGTELVRAVDAALWAGRVAIVEPVIHGEAEKVRAATEVGPEPRQRRDLFVHVGAEQGLVHVIAAQLTELLALRGVPQLFVNVVTANLAADRGVEAHPADLMQHTVRNRAAVKRATIDLLDLVTGVLVVEIERE